MNFKKYLLIVIAGFALTACATSKKQSGMMSGDVYTGSDTVEYLATGVKDRVFFATNKSTLTTASRDTLRKQAAWMRKKKTLSFTIEGHADERGTREYNLALGERRANAIAELLIINGVSKANIMTVSYGEEKPSARGSNESSWSKNRRALIKTF